MGLTMELIRNIKSFAREEDGVAAIEYALLGSLIAVGIIVTAGALGTKISDVFAFITTKLKSST
jgi:pilus assembly protein Flp/PilA